jgi:hypothetical protein
VLDGGSEGEVEVESAPAVAVELDGEGEPWPLCAETSVILAGWFSWYEQRSPSLIGTRQ